MTISVNQVRSVGLLNRDPEVKTDGPRSQCVLGGVLKDEGNCWLVYV